MADEIPRTFLDELREITGDVVPDFADTLRQIDPRVQEMLSTFVLDAITKSEGNAQVHIEYMMSSMLWWFLIGREHALRGYPSPIHRTEGVDDEVPDDISDLDRDA